MDPSKKLQHEQFTKQVGYQSAPEILSISISPFIFLLIRNILVIHLGLVLDHFLVNFLFDLLCIVFPLVLLLTIASDFVMLIVSISSVLAIGFSVVQLCKHKRNLIATFSNLGLIDPRDKTTMVLLLSCSMIMFVDLPICPRRFAKTATYGLGLMDVGTGLFLAVSSFHGSRALFNLSERTRFWWNIKRIVLPTLLLGMIRFLFVTLLGYQSVVEEYGVHWNFFFTFAVIRFASALVCTPWVGAMSKATRTVLCFALGFSCFYVSQLIHDHVEPFVRGDQPWPSPESRTNSLLVANTEGLLSLPGYLSIYFLGLGFYHSLRQIEQSKVNGTSKIFCVILVHGSLLVPTGGISYWLGLTNMSRRFANPAYVTFILFMQYFCTLLSWMLRGLTSAMATVRFPPSALLYTVSSHGMFYFIICNLSTGLINLSVNTLRFIPSHAVIDSQTGAYPITLDLAWPQLFIAVAYSFFTLLVSGMYSFGCGVPKNFE